MQEATDVPLFASGSEGALGRKRRFTVRLVTEVHARLSLQSVRAVVTANVQRDRLEI